MEKPIMFCAAMIRAILDGRKTQTRRVMVPQPPTVSLKLDAYNGGPQWNFWSIENKVCNNLPIWRCPYGQPGDTLWVRETWGLGPVDDPSEGGTIFYRADWPDEKVPPTLGDGKWHPSIHMPRWACRLLLELTDVRVQSVQEISEEDAGRRMDGREHNEKPEGAK